MKAKIAIAVILFLATILVGCTSSSAPAATATPQVTTPKPAVESLNAATSGAMDNYYAILDITVRNDGADGTIIVDASITQAGQTVENELPVYLTRNAKQVVRLVLPLKWKGGDWVPNVATRVP